MEDRQEDEMLDTDDAGHDDSGQESALAREGRDIGRRAWIYLRTRSTEHWLIFAGGVIIGMLVS